MGINSSTPQKTYKICMVCNYEHNIVNSDLMVLDSYYDGYHYKGNEAGKSLLLRCSRGHLLTYRANKSYIDQCVTEIEKNQLGKFKQIENENANLKKQLQALHVENKVLKRQICADHLEPSAPSEEIISTENIIPTVEAYIVEK